MKKMVDLRFVLGTVCFIIFAFIVVYASLFRTSPENAVKTAIRYDGKGIQKSPRFGVGWYYDIYDEQGIKYSLYSPSRDDNVLFDRNATKDSIVYIWIDPHDKHAVKNVYQTEVDGQIIHSMEQSLQQYRKDDVSIIFCAILFSLFAALLITSVWFEEKVIVALIYPVLLVVHVFNKISTWIKSKRKDRNKQSETSKQHTEKRF